jgi:hypothetical protein
MSRTPVPVGTPCCEKGCDKPRHVAKSGKVMTRCWEHYRTWNDARTNKFRASHGKPLLGKGLPGRARPPTVVIDEQARVVRQIRGNEIVREYPLPERGLHEETLAILKYRGWKIKFERGAA